MRIAAAVVAAGLTAAAGAQQQTGPDVVVILADDLGIGDLGCYNADSKIPTPAFDRIAAEGMRFTDVHSPSAVCTPTRYGVLTGRYCWRSRLKRGVLGGYSKALIEPGRPTLASVFSAKGYATGAFGKWHLGLGDAKRTDYTKPLRPGPLTVGFDRFWGIPASLDMPPYVWVDGDAPLHTPSETIKGSKHRRRGGGGFWRGGAIAPDFRHSDVLDTITARACDWIRKQARAKRRFFAYVALSAPHTPWLPAKEFRGKSGAGYYGDFVAQVDACVGRITKALDAAGIARDTLLIVTSDNGSHWPVADIKKWGHDANLGYRGQKADIWEGGHRVPFLVRWPGRVARGATEDALGCLVDLAATVATCAGLELPHDGFEDSFDLSPYVLGKDIDAPVRRSVVHHSAGGMFALRRGRWKLIEGRGSGGFTRPRRIAPKTLKPGAPRGQLYDLESDRAEAHNLWNEKPDLVAAMRAELGALRKARRSAPRR